jgi:hypothetical protein
MNKWCLALVMMLTGLAGTAQGKAADFPERSLTLTIDVYNYAKVDAKTMKDAEKVATRIVRETGVETRWVDISDSGQADLVEERSFDPTHITLDVLPRAMGDHLQLSNDVMGLAPGVGPDRQIVYVFYNRIDRVNGTQLQLEARLDGIYVRTSQTFGHAIAHEVGHLLLNTEGHSKTGIMRATWQLDDLRDVALGRLFFTSQQAEVIRAEVIRRVGRHQTVDTAGFESLGHNSR